MVERPGREALERSTHLSLPEVFAELGSGPEGLSSGEAEVRLRRVGPNAIPGSRGPSPARQLLEQMIHLFAVMLWVAAILAFVGGMPQLGWAIIAVVIINGVFSFAQEYRAERATRALSALLPEMATVIRDGRRSAILAAELVPGDLVLLREGDRISADARVTRSTGLRVDISTLTGESEALSRDAEPSPDPSEELTDRTNLVFAGTFVSAGSGRAAVVSTGTDTLLGGIARLTGEVVRGRTPLRAELDHAVKVIAAFAVGAGALFFGVSLWLGTPARDGFLFAIGVIVALVPEGLLPTLTLSLAISASRMASRGALVRHLEAVETLGSTTVICSDKTGTITANQMTARAAAPPVGRLQITGTGYDPAGAVLLDGRPLTREELQRAEPLFRAAALCNDSRLESHDGRWVVIGDPTEGALLVLARKAGVEREDMEHVAPRIADFPFDSDRRRMTTVHRLASGASEVLTKGSPEAVLAVCSSLLDRGGSSQSLSDEERARITAEVDALAADGLRVLAFASRTVEGDPPRSPEGVETDLSLIGLVGLADPVRPEVPEAVRRCRRAGIRVVMVTGDHPSTAAAVAAKAGLVAGPVVLGDDLPEDDDALQTLLADPAVTVLARVAPEQKLRIARALQALGEVVAMTGDGVNDGPALRQADIGVAMGVVGTDVARGAADIVLLDDNFAHIVEAVEEGRAAFDNIRRFLTYHLTDNVAELAPFVLWALSGGAIPLVLSVLQILALDIGTDLLPALALGAERPEPGTMRRPPRPRDARLLDRRVLGRAFGFLGPIEAVISLSLLPIGAALYLGWHAGSSLPDAGVPLATLSTLVFASIVTMQMANAFACRSTPGSLLSIGPLSNHLLVAAVGVEAMILLCFVHIPPVARLLGMHALSPWRWVPVLIAPFLLLAAEEARKAIVRRRREPDLSRDAAEAAGRTGRTARVGGWMEPPKEGRDVTMTSDLAGARGSLETADGAIDIYRLDALGDVHQLPKTVKILLENLLRRAGTRDVSDEDVAALAAWPGPAKSIAFMPGRVLMQDLTGVPAVVDLAAMRSAMARNGGDPSKVDPLVPADLIIDHSVQVDLFRTEGAYAANIEWEYRRNAERYALLRWAQQAFDGLRVVPPGAGICHQVNLEHLGQVVTVRDGVAFPDTLVGTDSHTTMINGLGVLGWGVGGIEAEAAMLGQPAFMPQPLMVGVRMIGSLSPGTTATDLVLTLTQMLRAHGVVGRFVEFFGDGLSTLSIADRATMSNMCPEYGATAAYFPVDAETLRYLAFTGRGRLVDVVERYTKEQGLFRSDDDPDPVFTEVLDLDLSAIVPSLAGPKRPQDRVALPDVWGSFVAAFRDGSEPDPKPTEVGRFESEGGSPEVAVDVSATIAPGTETPMDVDDVTVRHGSVVIAAITSCTNTSNPSVMLAAGLLARKAVEAGLETKPWVKTSLAPGSRVVTDYLDRAGLTPYLDKLGFSLVGYGCTTCIGNSGPLPEQVANAVDEGDLNVVAVLSGNRNFEGRIHPQVRASYLASPPLCVAYALAGSVQIDLTTEPLGRGADGPVFLSDIWPTAEEVAEAIRTSLEPQQFEHEYGRIWDGDEHWASLPSPSGPMYEWDPASTYVQEPPFFDGLDEAVVGGNIEGARVLVKVGDSITTDHISPAGSIKADSPAGEYLKAHGVKPSEFNSYGSRRGNHEVMMRGTFANIRLRNEMAPGTEGPWTTFLPSDDVMTVFDAAGRYREAGVPLAVIAGKEYGSGSSRDWAAKGPSLLGVRFVIAESYERIHRSNLVGMGVLPLQFAPGESAASLGLTGRETFSVRGLEDGVSPGLQVAVEAVGEDGTESAFTAIVRIDGAAEVAYFASGGLLRMVLRELLER